MNDPTNHPIDCYVNRSRIDRPVYIPYTLINISARTSTANRSAAYRKRLVARYPRSIGLFLSHSTYILAHIHDKARAYNGT